MFDGSLTRQPAAPGDQAPPGHRRRPAGLAVLTATAAGAPASEFLARKLLRAIVRLVGVSDRGVLYYRSPRSDKPARYSSRPRRGGGFPLPVASEERKRKWLDRRRLISPEYLDR